MIKSSKNHQPLYQKLSKYLIITPEGILDETVSSRVSKEDDLVIRQLDEGIYSILKEGKLIVDSLNKLASDYGYVIVLNSNRKEHQILQALTKLAESCKKEGLVMQRHPIIAGIVVRD